MIVTAWLILHFAFVHVCPVVLITGYPCPGCGLTRAFIFFFTGHPLLAFNSNPTFFLWMALLAAAIYLRYLRGTSLAPLKVPLIVICIITIAVYIFRMIFFFPGNAPMEYVPHNLINHIFGDR